MENKTFFRTKRETNLKVILKQDTGQAVHMVLRLHTAKPQKDSCCGNKITLTLDFELALSSQKDLKLLYF